MINDFCITELKLLLTEISIENYSNVSQVVGAIHSRIDELNNKIDEATQYEIDARADHFTENQFNG